MTDTTTRTEADAVADIVHDNAVQPSWEPIPELDAVSLITPDGVTRELVSLEKLADNPARARGTTTVHDADSFTQAVLQRADEGEAVLYADEEAHALVAILNDDNRGAPGWRDYRVGLALRPTEEWARWTKGQGLGDQERFALAIEDGEEEIVSPGAALMLEIAQSFHASVGSKFRQGGRLKDGQVQLVYEEDVQAKAGTSGDLTIPDVFTIQVAPFIGSEPIQVRARLRYRVAGAVLAIGYQLVHPERVEADAFNAVVADVEAQTNQEALAGPAPQPATPIGLR